MPTTITIQPSDSSSKFAIKLAADATPQSLARSQAHAADRGLVLGFSLWRETTVTIDGGVRWVSAPGASVSVSGDPGRVDPEDSTGDGGSRVLGEARVGD